MRSHLLYSVLALGLFVPLIIGCSPLMSSADSSKPQPALLNPLQTQRQGIKGTVFSLSGDFMPKIQDPATGKTPPQTQTRPVQTRVWVFSGRIAANGKRWAVSHATQHAGLVGQVTSNARGEFSVGLPPGEYTLLAQYGSNLYLNSFLGDGSYASVRVTPGKTTVVNLINSEGATF